MKKRVLSFLTALALCLGFLPGTAFAAETTVGLDFSSQESDSAGDGYSWAAETKTLTLTNFSQTLSDSSGNEIAITLPENSTLVLEGESTITNSCPGGTCIQYRGTLNIQGDGTLNLKLDMPVNSSCGKGIYEKKDSGTDNILTIESGTLNITGTAANTDSNGYIGISGAEVHLNGGAVNMKNIKYGVNAYYWWVPERRFFVNGGSFQYSKSSDYSGTLSYAVSSGRKGQTSATGEVSITGGVVDISGAQDAFSVASTPVSVTGGTLKIHDLVRQTASSGIVQNTHAFMCGSGSAKEAEPKIRLTGGDIQISGCDYILSAVNIIGMDMLEVGGGMDLTGLVRVDEYAIYQGQENLGASHVRIYGDYTLPDSISFHEGNSGFWDVGLAEGSILNIPQGMSFDLSKLSRTGEDFEIDGPGDTYDLSEGEIVNNGSLYLPNEPITTKERVAGLNISGSGDILVKDRQTGNTIATLYRVSYQDGSTVLKTGLSYIDGTVSLYTAEKEGFTLGGWYQDTSLEETWDFDTGTTSENLILYAKWDVKEYTVTFNTGGGSQVEAQTVAHGGTAAKPESDPTCEGYTFGGWFTDEACATAYDFGTPVTRDLTLYAKWEAEVYTVTFNTGDGSQVEAQTVVHGGTAARPKGDPTCEGYTFGGWFTDEACTAAYDFSTPVTRDLTLYAKWTAIPSQPSGGGSSSGGGGGSGSGSSTTTTTSNPDGSTTTTTKNPDGTTTTTVKQPGGTTSTTTQDPKTGAQTTVIKTPEGVSFTEERDKAGAVTQVQASVPGGAERVTLPASVDRDTALEITVQDGGSAVVEIPAEDLTPGTVAVIVAPDGSEKVVRQSVSTGDGVALTVEGSAVVKLVENGKTFSDVPQTHWAAEAAAFVSARELFSGTGPDTFSPNQPMSRGMLAVVLHNLERNPTAGRTGSFADVPDRAWYSQGVAWAAERGIISGYGDGQFGPNAPVTREQLAVILWRYAGSPAPSGSDLPFGDADQVSSWASNALRWAVENGILSGYGDGRLAPQESATRAQMAQILKRFLEQQR